ncbi:hypothetical protein E2C01_077799 [Portunus trituberculatus]|uniref:Uncharacterized protein n=1 Tax=Portunus trituberculatus TaxID=210409 RepID=A0A5B7IQW1_PORTR|nr:hypothetical protein [Portunus trituberculatus]
MRIGRRPDPIGFGQRALSPDTGAPHHPPLPGYYCHNLPSTLPSTHPPIHRTTHPDHPAQPTHHAHKSWLPPSIIYGLMSLLHLVLFLSLLLSLSLLVHLLSRLASILF